ncbi:MAG: DUF2971 domain-containing protein [Burkholderiales bacterium]|nr:DUF2971 domain-containing protein [Burkholderiales bacterium]
MLFKSGQGLQECTTTPTLNRRGHDFEIAALATEDWFQKLAMSHDLDPVSDTHPELFHYTNEGGLHGILRSQFLRATHWQHLDDTQELIQLRETLVELIHPTLLLETSGRAQSSSEFRHWATDSGGENVFARTLCQQLTDSMNQTLLNDDPQSQIFDFFITSFCTPPGNCERVREHGLLSQWRSYGRNGGYAIVFDTVGLETLMKVEASQWSCLLSLGDVGYSSDALEVLFQRLEHLPQLVTALRDFITRPTAESSHAVLRPFLECATRLKHWAFSEEHEVRLVVILDGTLMHRVNVADGIVVKEHPRSTFNRCGSPVPCLNLFDGIGVDGTPRLPIRRIIVGPGPDQADREAILTDFLKQYDYTIPVTRSEIPVRF